jgi:hypothetical protein
VTAGEAEREPAVRRHQGTTLDVPAELLRLGVLTAFVLEGDLPPRVAEVGMRDLASPAVDHGNRDLGLR